jgi:hypothetical protein
MADTIKQSQAVVWVQEGGDGQAFIPYADGAEGMAMTGKTIPVVGIAPVYTRDANGNPLVIDLNETAPGDLPTATIQVYERSALTILERMVEQKCPLNFQLRMVACGPLDNPFIWDKIVAFSKGKLTTYNPGDGPSLDFNGELMTASGAVSFENVLFMVRTGLSALTLVETENIQAIDGLSEEDCAECGTGYPGADKIMAIGADAAGAAIANGYVTDDGGSTWTVFSALPFIADEHFDFIQMRLVGPSTVRYIGHTSVTGATKAQMAYAEAEFGALDTVTWTKSAYTNTTVGDVVTAALWARHDRHYVATDANDIIIDKKQGGDDDAEIAYAGAQPINAFAVSSDGRTVYAAGDANLIVRELNQNDLFVVRNGPSGGGAFSALAVARDGTLYAGNGTSIFKSVDGAAQAGNWEELNDFGAGHTVVSIGLVKGDSQYLKVVTTEAADGHVYESVDGGNSWREITGITDAGYSDAYHSETNSNLAYIAGLASGGLGQVHQLAAVA